MPFSQYGPHQSPVSSGHGPELDHKQHAVSFNGLISKLIYSEGQQICDQMMKTTRAKFLIMIFLWSNGCYFCAEVCVDVESEPGVVGCDVNGFTETKFIQKFSMSGAILNYIC